MYAVPAVSVILDPAHYGFNPHALPLFAAAALVGFFGVRVLSYQRNRMTMRFAALCFAVMVWMAGTAMGYLVATDPAIAAFWFRLDWLGVSVIPGYYFAYTSALLGRKDSWITYLGYALGFFFAFTTLIWNPQMREVVHFYWGFFPQLSYTWSPCFLIYFFAYAMMSFLTYRDAIPSITDPIRRSQIRWMFWAFLSTYVGSVDFLPSYGIRLYPFGFVAVAYFVCFTAYAIVSYHIMDIRVVVRKTIIYSAITGVLTTGYLILATQLPRIFTGGSSPTNFWALAFSAAAMALLVNPIQNRVRRFLDERFFGNWLQDMSRGMAHEVKRPLNSISLPAGLAMIILDDVAQGKRRFEEALPQVRDQLNLIMNTTLDTANRIDAMQRVADENTVQQAVSLRELAEKCLKRLKSIIDQTPLTVNIDVDPDVSPAVGDPQQLEIALGNLLKNAIEALRMTMKKNTLMSNCSLSFKAWEASDRIFFSVKDNGPGMTLEVRERLFEPYRSTKGSAGMGIGLYLTHKIIRNHGGTIQVRSRIGEGTEFIVDLPKFEQSRSKSSKG